MPPSQPNLRIRLVRSTIGYAERQKATVRALGLRRLHQTVERPDNEAVRGMILKVQHLVRVEAADKTVSTSEQLDDKSPKTAAAPPGVPRTAQSADVQAEKAGQVADQTEEPRAPQRAPSSKKTAADAPGAVAARPSRKRKTE